MTGQRLQQQHPTVSTSSSRELLLELKRHQQQGRSTLSGSTSSNSNDSSSSLPPYNLKLVRESLQDIQWHLKEAELEIQAATVGATDTTVGVDGETTTTTTAATSTTDSSRRLPNRFAPKPSISLHDSIVQRHKRCLLAYHIHRAQALQQQVILDSLSSSSTSTSLTSTNPTTTNPTTTTTTTTTTTPNPNSPSFAHLTQNAPEWDFCQAYHQLQKNYWQTVLPDMDSTMTTMTNTFSATRFLPPPSATGNVQVRCLIDQGSVVLDSGRSITFSKGSILYLPKSDVWEWMHNGTLQLLEGEEVDF